MTASARASHQLFELRTRLAQVVQQHHDAGGRGFHVSRHLTSAEMAERFSYTTGREWCRFARGRRLPFLRRGKRYLWDYGECVQRLAHGSSVARRTA